MCYNRETMNNTLFYIPSLDNLNAYKNAVKAIKDLSPEQEVQLAKKMHSGANEGALRSAQTLIVSQLKTVVKIAYEYKNYGLDQSDLIQEGNIGLMKAVKNFDPAKNVRLYTFSLVWIRAEIQAYILKNWKMVKIATTKNLKKLFFNYRSLYKEFEQNGVSKSQIPEKIKNSLGVSQEDVVNISHYFGSEDLHLDALQVLDEENTDNKSKNFVPQQLIEYKTPEYNVSLYRDKDKMYNSLEKAIKNLGDRERQIIEMRYFGEEKKTHKEISQKLNISSERVRQLEMSTIEKLKNIISL